MAAAVATGAGSPGSASTARPTRSSPTSRASSTLHELAVEDAVHAHQRAKLERYGDTLFCVLRPARYIDETETVEFGEVHVFAGPQFVITVRHGEAPDLGDVRRRPRGPPRPAPPRAGRDPARDPRSRGRRLRPGRRGRRERHRRDRGRGLRRERRRLAPHLRAHPRGDRVPARHQAARPDARAADGRPGASTTRSAATCATSRTTRCASRSRPTASASCCRTSSTSTSRSRPRRSARHRTGRTRRSRRSPPGRRSCSRPRWSGRSTA